MEEHLREILEGSWQVFGRLRKVSERCPQDSREGSDRRAQVSGLIRKVTPAQIGVSLGVRRQDGAIYPLTRRPPKRARLWDLKRVYNDLE